MMVSRRRRDRERRVLHEAIHSHGDMVYRLAFRVLGNRADAEDTAQEVFLKLLRAREGSSRVKRLRGWLAITALNTARKTRRRHDRQRRREQAWAAVNGRDVPEDDASGREVWRVVESLPDVLRVPVILHYQEGFKYREIAEALGCPPGTVATRLASAKARLRSLLKESGAHPSCKITKNC